jgi:hypothetical protein
MEQQAMAERVKGLAPAFTSDDVKTAFHEFEDCLAYYEGVDGKRHFFPAYVPFVGQKYESSRILVYAKAQNLARNPDVREQYYQNEEHAIFRLCKTNERQPIYTQLNIGPVSCGVLPALAGVFLYALERRAIGDLSDVTSNLAITNFYKFSLWQVRRHPVNSNTQQDLNPDSWDRDRVGTYTQKTYDLLVRPEIDLLQPRAVLCLNGKCCPLLWAKREECGFTLREVNDPAWILRGGGRCKGGIGCLTENGSWGKVAGEQKDEGLRKLVNGYCDQVRENGWGGYKVKTDAIRIYLKYYYAKFTSARA